MTISAHVVFRPRKLWGCCNCRKAPDDAPHVVLYGCADRGDPPYRLRICIDCAAPLKDEKVRAALDLAACASDGFRRLVEAVSL